MALDDTYECRSGAMGDDGGSPWRTESVSATICWREVVVSWVPTDKGPIAMNALSNCCRAWRNRASAPLTAACSLRPSAQPGRPAAPTATAFQPVEASAIWRATSSRASVEDHRIVGDLEETGYFSGVGIGTTK